MTGGIIRTRGAVLWGAGTGWSVEEVALEPPGPGEVLVAMAAAGICHSDEHFVSGDSIPSAEMLAATGGEEPYPFLGGHEGAGVVAEVGPGVTGLREGDHVVTSWLPACGTCRYCVRGESFLCDLGALLFQRGTIADGKVRHTARGQALLRMTQLGTFAEHMLVHQASLVRIGKDVPLPQAALTSCCVGTGLGAATTRAGTRPGDVVVVVGAGGIGMNAVQGAALAGARAVVVVEPVGWKRDAAVGFGATAAVASLAEAVPFVRDLTEGRMAERVVLTPGVADGEILAAGIDLTGKGGTCVSVAMAPLGTTAVRVDLSLLALLQKELKGTVYGGLNPRNAVPELLDMYRAGRLKLDELITRTYSLDDIDQGFQDLRDGRNIRGVVVFP